MNQVNVMSILNVLYKTPIILVSIIFQSTERVQATLSTSNSLALSSIIYIATPIPIPSL